MSCILAHKFGQLLAQQITNRHDNHIHRNRNALAQDEIVASRVEDRDSLPLMINEESGSEPMKKSGTSRKPCLRSSSTILPFSGYGPSMKGWEMTIRTSPVECETPLSLALSPRRRFAVNQRSKYSSCVASVISGFPAFPGKTVQPNRSGWVTFQISPSCSQISCSEPPSTARPRHSAGSMIKPLSSAQRMSASRWLHAACRRSSNDSSPVVRAFAPT